MRAERERSFKGMLLCKLIYRRQVQGAHAVRAPDLVHLLQHAFICRGSSSAGREACRLRRMVNT